MHAQTNHAQNSYWRDSLTFVNLVDYRWHEWGNVTFRASVFEKEANFQENVFYLRTDFDFCHFRKRVSFKYAAFEQMIKWQYLQFDEVSDFGYLKARKGLEINNSVMRKTTYFWFGEFSDRFCIQNTTFKADAAFIESCFDSLSFRQITFAGEAVFNDTKFAGPVIFNGVTCQSHVDFAAASFSTRLQFTNVRFGGMVNFAGTALPDTLVIDNLESEFTLDFSKSALPVSGNQKCVLRLSNVKGLKLKLHPCMYVEKQGILLNTSLIVISVTH